MVHYRNLIFLRKVYKGQKVTDLNFKKYIENVQTAYHETTVVNMRKSLQLFKGPAEKETRRLRNSADSEVPQRAMMQA